MRSLSIEPGNGGLAASLWKCLHLCSCHTALMTISWKMTKTSVKFKTMICSNRISLYTHRFPQKLWVGWYFCPLCVNYQRLCTFFVHSINHIKGFLDKSRVVLCYSTTLWENPWHVTSIVQTCMIVSAFEYPSCLHLQNSGLLNGWSGQHTIFCRQVLTSTMKRST